MWRKMVENWLAAVDGRDAPDPAALRDHARQCREAARSACDPALKRDLARRAFASAQIAEQAERHAASAPPGSPRRALGADYDRVRAWREAAEECRAFAEQLMFRDTRASYRRLVDQYEAMAEREERLAGAANSRRREGGPAV